MRLDAPVLYLLTFISFAGAYVIPFRRVRIPEPSLRSPGGTEERRDLLPPDLGKDLPIPSPVITLVATGSQPSPTSSLLSTTTGSTTAGTPTASIASTTTPTSTESTPQPSQPPADNDGSQKYVVAHHMVGNTFPYTLQDWADDIQLAHASGLDGFALNMGRDDWQPARVADAYQAAEQSGLDFKLFLSLDMSSFPCSSPNDAQTLRNLVNAHASHPNQLLYANRAFVSTFAGELCNFGQGSAPDGWKSQFSQHPDLAGKIYFVPAFFVDPATFKDFADVMDGDFNWNSAWPIQVTTSFVQNILNSLETNPGSPATLLSVVKSATNGLTDLEQALENAVTSSLSKLQLSLAKFIGATDTDKQHLDGLATLSGTVLARDGETSKRAYMGSVSPWFFTHYGPDSFNKNFVFLSDQHLYSKRWEALINSRDQFDIVEVLTWNDYGESHYIGPIKGAQPNSEAWTDGMNHTAWLELTEYYATAFKTGTYPTIEKDKIIMWSRPHSTKAQTSDPVPQPTNFELFEDAVWALVMTTAPSTVTLSTSDTTSKDFQVPAGVSKLLVPIAPGGFMRGVIERDGQTVVQLQPETFSFQGSPTSYNFNAFVASATAD